MLSDIITLFLAIAGIVFILLWAIFRLMTWQEDNFTFTLPLYSADNSIFDRICNIRAICELLGIHKKSTVVIINYGAAEWFCKKLSDYFKESNFIKIVPSSENFEEFFKE